MRYDEYEKRAEEFDRKERELYEDMRDRIARHEQRRHERLWARRIVVLWTLALVISLASIILVFLGTSR